MKSIKKKIGAITMFTTLAALITIALLVSCKSTQKLFNQSNLTILVLDENDMPVNEFEIQLTPVKKISAIIEKSGITNQNGITVFYNTPFEPYIVSGQKEGYSKIKPQEINIQANGDLFCFKVSNADYLLSQTEQLYSINKFSEAVDFLEGIECQSNQPLMITLIFYKAFGYVNMGQKEKAGLLLQQLKELDNPAFETSRYCEAIEKILGKLQQPD